MSTDAPTERGSTAAVVDGVETSGDAADASSGSVLLRVTKGSPTPEELAALTAVVAAAAQGGSVADTGPLDRWANRDDALDGPPRVFSPRAYQAGRLGGH